MTSAATPQNARAPFGLFQYFFFLPAFKMRHRAKRHNQLLRNNPGEEYFFFHSLITVVVLLHITGRVLRWRAQEHTGKINGGEWRGAGGCGWADGWWSKPILFSLSLTLCVVCDLHIHFFFSLRLLVCWYSDSGVRTEYFRLVVLYVR